MTKEDALRQIVELCSEHEISADELLSSLSKSGPAQKHPFVRKFFSWLGGIFILAGLGALYALIWEDLDSIGRILLTLVPSVMAHILGVVTSRSERYEKMSTPLILVGGLLAPTAILIAAHELFPEGGEWHLPTFIAFGVPLLQQIVTFISCRRTSVAFLAIAFGALTASVALDWIDLDRDWNAFVIGLSLMLVANGLAKTKFTSITSLWNFVGSAIWLPSVFAILENSAFEVFFLGASTLIIYVSSVLRSKALLVTGLIATLSYLAYYTNKYFADSLGWPIILLIFGALFFVISGIVIRQKA